MRLLLYQPTYTGHHYPYLARMLPGFFDVDVQLILATTPGGVQSDVFERFVAPHAEHLEVLPVCEEPPEGMVRGALHRARESMRLIDELEVDHACLLYGDGLWQLLAAAWLSGYPRPRRRVPIEMWLYRGGFTYPDATRPADQARRALFRGLMRTKRVARLHLDDEYLYDFAREQASQTEIALTPNPVVLFERCSKARARARLGLPTRGRIAALTAMIDRRKGADLALRAFAAWHARNPAQRSHLVLAGPHHAAIRSILSQPDYRDLVEAGVIVSHDRFLDEREMYDYAAASDVVLAPYPNHSGRSSLVLWAAAAGRPSLGAARGCIGRVIRDHRLGWTVDPTNIAAFADALGRAFASTWRDTDARRARAYAKTHSEEEYQRRASALARARFGVVGP